MPNRRPHRRTGRQKGAPYGNSRAQRHGCDSAAALARRKEVNAVLRAARRVIRDFAAKAD
jgi:hypothetical protein